MPDNNYLDQNGLIRYDNKLKGLINNSVCIACQSFEINDSRFYWRLAWDRQDWDWFELDISLSDDAWGVVGGNDDYENGPATIKLGGKKGASSCWVFTSDQGDTTIACRHAKYRYVPMSDSEGMLEGFFYVYSQSGSFNGCTYGASITIDKPTYLEYYITNSGVNSLATIKFYKKSIFLNITEEEQGE